MLLLLICIAPGLQWCQSLDLLVDVVAAPISSSEVSISISIDHEDAGSNATKCPRGVVELVLPVAPVLSSQSRSGATKNDALGSSILPQLLKQLDAETVQLIISLNKRFREDSSTVPEAGGHYSISVV